MGEVVGRLWKIMGAKAEIEEIRKVNKNGDGGTERHEGEERSVAKKKITEREKRKNSR